MISYSGTYTFDAEKVVHHVDISWNSKLDRDRPSPFLQAQRQHAHHHLRAGQEFHRRPRGPQHLGVGEAGALARLLLLPAVRGEGRDEGASRLGLSSRPKSAAPLRRLLPDSRRGPLTLGRFAPSTSPRAAGRGAADKQIRSRGALSRPSFANHHATKNRLAPGNKGRRSADRRIVLPIAACAAAHPSLDAPAYRRFTAAFTTGYYPDGSAPEPGFPKTQARRCFARLPLVRG